MWENIKENKMKLLDLLLEESSCDATKCDGAFQVLPSGVNADTYKNSPEYLYCETLDKVTSQIVRKYCKKKASTPPPVTPPASTDKCPSEEGYVDKEFQEWVWKTHLGKAETDTIQTKLCGIKSNGVAKTCGYSAAVGTGCGTGTKAVWKELKDKFIASKNQTPVVQQETEQQKMEKCKAQNLIYDATTGGCVVPVQEVDPDVQTLKDQMESYRDILGTFTDNTGWSQIDTLTPNKFIPNSLDIFLLEEVTTQIITLIKRKGRSKDFELFKRMMQSLVDAYSVEKYKDFFTKEMKVKNGQDVFTYINGLITKIDESAKEIEDSYNFNSLTNPEETDIRNQTFSGQFIKVYKTGKVNLMMMVYFYTGNQRLKGDDNFDSLWSPKPEYWNDKEKVLKKVYDVYKTVHGNYDFDNCKKILGVYKDTIESNNDRKNYDQSPQLKERMKDEIKKCWCSGQYKELGKLGVKNMFDREMKQDRKELIKFLNSLNQGVWGDFAVDLSSKCGDFEEYK